MLVGILAALGAGGLVYYLSLTQVPTAAAVPPTTVAVATATPLPREALVLAAHDILPRQLVTAADVVTREYPIGLAPDGAFHITSEVISRTATTQVFGGEILLARQFTENQGGPTDITSDQLPAGKVLVAFPASDILSSVDGVRAGDHVDILVTLPVSGTTGTSAGGSTTGGRYQAAQATMQDVTVYSRGSPAQPVANTNGNGGTAASAVITFVVDHQEALILKYIKDSGGTVDLVVRSIKDTKEIATDPVSLDYLIELYHFANAPRP